MNPPLTDAERKARLRLIRSQSIGPVTFYKLLGRFGSAISALENLPLMASKGGRKKPLKIMSDQDADNELRLLSSIGGEMIVYGDAAYPEMLSNIEDAPPVLNIMGDVSLLNQSCVAIVGTRNASVNARKFTQKIASELGRAGHVIVSGMARGIDTAAHEASLETGTIAVLAGGIDEIYPTENTNLYNEIIKTGCIVSEMPVGTKPTAHHFPRRNRIVSGLSKGTVVVEASMKSGSLITARLAGEQGRDVFAVPGFPGDPRGYGPNYLIQNGAKLVTRSEDILSELAYIDSRSIKPEQPTFEGISEPDINFEHEDAESLDSLHDVIIEALSHTPVDIDEIVRLCDVPVHYLQTTLLELEIAGQLQRHPGNRVSKVA
ncbi:MAG: DNA-protecting protein DprA [Alphaproteobacteria bacterium]|nr:MAG: DNA-protecting protein DprA [Alphaproteobacteria bacterium]